MARPFAKKFYESYRWKQCRDSYIKKKLGICERCGHIGKIVHHKIHIDEENINNMEITLNHNNLELLCQPCHNAEHMGLRVIDSDLVFDEWGNIKHKSPYNELKIALNKHRM